MIQTNNYNNQKNRNTQKKKDRANMNLNMKKKRKKSLIVNSALQSLHSTSKSGSKSIDLSKKMKLSKRPAAKSLRESLLK